MTDRLIGAERSVQQFAGAVHLAQLDRLDRALRLVRNDLEATLPRAPRLFLHAVLDEIDGVLELATYVAEPGSGDDALAGARYCGNFGWLLAETDEQALSTVADAVQDHLAQVRLTVWPICPVHAHGVHVTPCTDQHSSGRPTWWCRSGGGHELARVGSLT